MLWAACCTGYFGFMRSEEFTLSNAQAEPAITAGDVAFDLHTNQSICWLFLYQSKTDLKGWGTNIYLGRTNSSICPVSAMTNYLAMWLPIPGPFSVFENGTLLLRDHFVQEIKQALRVAGLDETANSGHSFQIGAATSTARARVPAFLIKLLGRWGSEAYQLYVRTPRETLAAISSMIAWSQGTYPLFVLIYGHYVFMDCMK